MSHHSKQSTDILVWGNNQSTLLSSSSSKIISIPKKSMLPHAIAHISASEKHISYLTETGQVYSYGINLDGRLGIGNNSYHFKTGAQNPLKISFPNKVKRLECGFSHVVIISENEDVYAWGLGDYGALGIGQFKSKTVPTKMILRSLAYDIAAGAMHTAIITKNNQIYMCGSNQYGQLGINKPQKVSTPVLIDFSFTVKQIACGVFYTLLLTETGQVYGMGNNKYGQLGLGHKVNQFHPTLIRDLVGITKITAGYHSAGIDYYGNLYIWGSGSFGQYLKPKKFTFGIPFRSLEIRGFFGMVIGDERVYVWGNNTYGQLGNGNYDAAKEPVQVQALRGLNIKNFTCGVNFTIVLIDKNRPLIQQPESISYVNAYSTRKASYQNNLIHQNALYGNSLTSRVKERSKSPYSFLHETSKRKQSEDHSNRFKDANLEIRRDNSSHRVPPPNKGINYEELFNNLSFEYEELLRKYSYIQGHLNSVQRVQAISPNRESVRRQQEFLRSNQIYEKQINHLTHQLSIVKEELRLTLQKLTRVQDERDQLIIARTRDQNNTSNQKLNNMQFQYNKLLDKKEDLIAELNIAHQRQRKDYEEMIKNMKQQIKNLKEINTHNEEKISIEKMKFQRLQKDVIILRNHDEQLLLLEKTLKAENRQLLVKIQKLHSENLDLIKNKQQFLKIFEEQEAKAQKTLEQQINKHIQSNNSLIQQLKNLQIKLNIQEQEITALKIQSNYEKQIIKRYDNDFKLMTEDRQRLKQQLQHQKQTLKQEKQKTDKLKIQLNKMNGIKRQLDGKINEIEDLKQTLEKTKRKLEGTISNQQQVIKEQKREIQDKIKEYDNMNESKTQEIKTISDRKRMVEKELQSAEQDLAHLKERMKQKDEELVQSNDQYKALHKKYLGKMEEVDRQREQKEQISEQLSNTKKIVAKLKSQKENVERKLEEEKTIRLRTQQELKESDRQIQQLKQQLEKYQQKIKNIQEQNKMIKGELQDANNLAEEQNRINDELSKANKQFAENEAQFNDRIAELQAKIYELQCENKSYLPRYEALIQRNKQLDERNRQLSDMVNKAIEIQAQSYKNNILKDVQIDTNHIIQQVKQQQVYVRRNRRNIPEPPKIHLEEHITPEITSRVKQNKEQLEPYSKFAQERISEHKRKVSESARKLAGILDLEQGSSKSRGKSISKDPETLKKQQDFEKINRKMESLQLQKEEFMSKINSFAEKLKIL